MNPYELITEIIAVLENSNSTIDDIAQFTNDIYEAQGTLRKIYAPEEEAALQARIARRKETQERGI